MPQDPNAERALPPLPLGLQEVLDQSVPRPANAPPIPPPPEGEDPLDWPLKWLLLELIEGMEREAAVEGGG